MTDMEEFRAKPPCPFVQMVKLPDGSIHTLWRSVLPVPPVTEKWDYRHEYAALMCRVRSHPSWRQETKCTAS